MISFKEQNLFWKPTNEFTPVNGATCFVTVCCRETNYKLNQDISSAKPSEWVEMALAIYEDGKWFDFWNVYQPNCDLIFEQTPTEPKNARTRSEFTDLPLMERVETTDNGYIRKEFYSGKYKACVREIEVTAFCEVPDAVFDNNCRFCAMNGGENCEECETQKSYEAECEEE